MANPKIQLRHDTAANWTSVNPVLLEGEVGIETDTKKFKVGDGNTAWTSLAYGNADTEAIDQLEQDYGSLVDKVDELGNSIPEPNLFTTPLGNSLFDITNISDLPIGKTIINTSCTTTSNKQPMFAIMQGDSKLWYVGINPGTTNLFRVGFGGTTYVTMSKAYKVKIILNKVSNTEIYAKGILYNLDNTTVLLESSFDNVSSGNTFDVSSYGKLTSNLVSLSYDNKTIKVNESGQLYADTEAMLMANLAYERGKVTDDVEAFVSVQKYAHSSGNKTGLDVIKPDNFEKVGNPTVTEDGVVSNILRGTNIIKLPFSTGQLKDKSWEIVGYKTTITAEEGIETFGLSLAPAGDAEWGIVTFLSTSKKIVFKGYTGEEKKVQGVYIAKTFDANPEFYIPKVKYNNITGEYSFYADFGNGFELIGTQIPATANKQLTTILRNIMTKLELNSYTGTGSITFDLNSYRVYIEGELVYQPCLKIPYKLSKTGSKIVDVSARNRVQALYEETGEALYYTIDEVNENVTLPMGEVYGMITKNREFAEHADLATQKAYIVETYANGGDGYIVYSNKLCQQWGYTTFNASGTTLTFMKKFRDTNYNLLTSIYTGATNTYGQTINVSSYTQSGFTAYGGDTSSVQNKDGWWQAIGYIE